jgi:hypothetical protein
VFGPGLDGEAHSGDVLSGPETHGYGIILVSDQTGDRGERP